MTRDEYLKKMQAALDRLQVKASLAKLELRDVQRELLAAYDGLTRRLQDVREASEERWDATRQAVDAAWQAFKARFEKVMAEHRSGEH